MLASLRLFKALPVNLSTSKHAVDEELAAKTLKDGYLFAPLVTAQYANRPELLQMVADVYGRDASALNNALHKTFAKVRDAPMQQLVVEQMIHYFSTYGLQQLGLFSNETVYIPAEQLKVPGWKDTKLRVIVIRGLTHPELKAELLQLLASGVALSEQSVKDALSIAHLVKFERADIEQVRNHEVRAALYDYFGSVPADPIDFLRLMVFRATETTLLIKSPGLIAKLKERDNHTLVGYFRTYERDFGLAPLATIFYRYKPLFLAMRTNTALRVYINQIRRLAPQNHRPMAPDLLNELTAQARSGKIPNQLFLEGALANATPFRKIRAAQALRYRAEGNPDSIVYRIRNGKSWATELAPIRPDARDRTRGLLELVHLSLVADLRRRVGGRRIYIPKGLNYGLPATEKQFIGELPFGSYVELKKHDLVCGIHWEDVGSYTVDLDLSLTNQAGKIGWDGSYRNNRSGIWFSGDLTSAPPPRGASEVYRISQGAVGSWLMHVNYYNYHGHGPAVPFKIMAGSEKKKLTTRHVVDPNQMLAWSNSVIDVQHQTLGLIVGDGKSLRFYFGEFQSTQSRSVGVTKVSEQIRNYMEHNMVNSVSLNEVLIQAEAVMVDSAEEAEIDLSSESINKGTLIKLLSGVDDKSLVGA